MTAFPIPPHQVKSGTWYYGLRCTCSRLHAICEDLFRGKTDEQHLECADSLEFSCECGTVLQANRLEKFRTP